MKKSIIILIAAFIILNIIGCSPDKAPSENKDGVIPEHQLRALEKAEQTEDLIKNAEQQRRKQLE